MLKRETADFSGPDQKGNSNASSDHLTDPLQAGTGSVGEGLQGLAEQGFGGTPSQLPHRDTIQQSFGAHDLTSLKSYQDKPAQQANQALGSQGLAQGDSVALKTTDLHTAAHEAAHVIQQRSGVHAKGELGRSSDPLEKHADAVADKVVAGESAEGLLSEVSGGNSGSLVQPKLNYTSGWTTGLFGQGWAEGAGELWGQIQGSFDNIFLPRWSALEGVDVPEGELKRELDRLSHFADYDGQKVTMEQGVEIRDELLPLLDKSPLQDRVTLFKQGFDKELEALRKHAADQTMGSGNSYKAVKPEFTRLQRQIAQLVKAPDYVSDLDGLRAELDGVMQRKEALVEQHAQREKADRAVKQDARREREAEEAANRDASESFQRLSEKVQAWRGAVSVDALAGVGTLQELEAFVGVVSPGKDVGRLVNLSLIPGSAVEFLALVKAHQVRDALPLVGFSGASASSLLSYLDAAGSPRRAPELLELCASVQGATGLLAHCSLTQAIDLMRLGGVGNEVAVGQLIVAKGVEAVAALLNTDSGSQNANEVLTALTGNDKLSDEQAPALLATPGMRGTPKSTKKLMTNAKVLAEDDALTTATELLSEKANAADVLAILGKESVENTLKLAKTAHVKGSGKEVKWILEQNVSVPNTVKLLKYKDGKWGKKVLEAHKHAPENIVHINASLENGKAVWDGTAAGQPVFEDKHGSAVTEDVVTQNTGGLDKGGTTYHTQGFVNTPQDTETMLLPKHGQNYQEYDIKPYMSEKRGTKRIVIAAEKFYTSNHYVSFGKYA